MFSPNSGNLNSEGPVALEVGAPEPMLETLQELAKRELQLSSLLEQTFAQTPSLRQLFSQQASSRQALSRRDWLRSFGLRASSIFNGENHLSDFYFLAFSDANFFDRAGHGRRNLDTALSVSSSMTG